MNEKQAAAALTRERLIEAAMVVLQTGGAQTLTLDAVAKQAQVSKGGLLHHFRSKDALIEALVNHLYALFNGRVQHYYDSDPEPVGRWARAYVRASFDDFDIPLHVLMTLFLYVNTSETLKTIVQNDVSYWEERFLSDGLPPERATIVRMICDAYWTERAVRVDTRVNPKTLLDEVLKLTR